MQLQLTLSETQKACSKCGSFKDLSEFSRDRSRPDGLFLWCKPCSRKSVATRYHESEEVKLAHREAQRRFKASKRGEEVTFDRKPRTTTAPKRKNRNMQKHAASQKKRSLATKALSQSIKSFVGCQSCGEREPVVIDFHHIDPSTKSFVISRQGRDRSINAYINEILKCCCVCANCHRKHHFGVLLLNDLRPLTLDQIEQAIRAMNDANDVQ